MAIQQKLTDDSPAVSGFRDVLAFTHLNFGELLRQIGKSSEAEAEYRAALAIQSKLDEDNVNYRGRLALSHINLGLLAVGCGQVSGS